MYYIDSTSLRIIVSKTYQANSHRQQAIARDIRKTVQTIIGADESNIIIMTSELFNNLRKYIGELSYGGCYERAAQNMMRLCLGNAIRMNLEPRLIPHYEG